MRAELNRARRAFLMRSINAGVTSLVGLGLASRQVVSAEAEPALEPQGNPIGIVFGEIAEDFQFDTVEDEADLVQKLSSAFGFAGVEFDRLAQLFTQVIPELDGLDQSLATRFRQDFSTLSRDSVSLAGGLAQFTSFSQLLGQPLLIDAVERLRDDFHELRLRFDDMNIFDFRPVAGSMDSVGNQLDRIRAALSNAPDLGGEAALAIAMLSGFRGSLIEVASQLAFVSAFSAGPLTQTTTWPFQSTTVWTTTTFLDGRCGPWKKIVSTLPGIPTGVWARACNFVTKIETTTIVFCYRTRWDRFNARDGTRILTTTHTSFGTAVESEVIACLFSTPEDDEAPHPPAPRTRNSRSTS